MQDTTEDITVETTSNSIAEALRLVSEPIKEIEVTLSNDVARLLSKQLYRSPLKAVEELVVNSYDADAGICRLWVPEPNVQDGASLLVYDDGVGMNSAGLNDLWQIGHSGKRETTSTTDRYKRKQIGRFGIGKLATYAISNRLTYFTKSSIIDDDLESGSILSVTINFSSFIKDETQTTLQVREVSDWAAVVEIPALKEAADKAGINLVELESQNSWTIALLEELKAEEAAKLKSGALKWVLSTAMPLGTGFELYLNNVRIQSSKENYTRLVDFEIGTLSNEKLKDLETSTGEVWTKRALTIANGAGKTAAHTPDSISRDRSLNYEITSRLFPSGIRGFVFVTERSLLTGKSSDIERSHGFFVYVRDRLINIRDPQFGLDPQSLGTFNRMHAVVFADDLDLELTASREGIEEGSRLDQFKAVLKATFNQARAFYNKKLKEKEDKNTRQGEGTRTFVDPALIEHPVADVLSLFNAPEGASADEEWVYLDVPSGNERRRLAEKLYAEKIDADKRGQYTYEYSDFGAQEQIVRFRPADRTFVLNESHAFVQSHSGNSHAATVLQDVAVAEALLEVYLREANLPPALIRYILDRRDTLLRSLANDRPYAPKKVAQDLRDAAADERGLEFALVAAARSLGFSAEHLSNSDQADGLAWFVDYAEGKRAMALEAKATTDVKGPKISAIDFSSLSTHTYEDLKAGGCLLVTRRYRGLTKEENARIAKNAMTSKVSCWTVEQLARVVEAAGNLRITAADIHEIVRTRYAPLDVDQAVESLLNNPNVLGPPLFIAILDALQDLEQTQPAKMGHPRQTAHVHARLTSGEFSGLDEDVLDEALRAIQAVAKGGLVLSENARVISLTVVVEELYRRASSLTKVPGSPRRPSTFTTNTNI